MGKCVINTQETDKSITLSNFVSYTAGHAVGHAAGHAVGHAAGHARTKLFPYIYNITLCQI